MNYTTINAGSLSSGRTITLPIHPTHRTRRSAMRFCAIDRPFLLMGIRVEVGGGALAVWEFGARDPGQAAGWRWRIRKLRPGEARRAGSAS